MGNIGSSTSEDHHDASAAGAAGSATSIDEEDGSEDATSAGVEARARPRKRTGIDPDRRGRSHLPQKSPSARFMAKDLSIGIRAGGVIAKLRIGG